MTRHVTLGYLVSWWALVMYVVFVSVLILERLVWSGLAKRSCLHPCWHLQLTWNVGSAFGKVLGTLVVWNTSVASSAHDHWRHDTCDVSLYFMHERCAVSSNRSSVLMLLMKTYGAKITDQLSQSLYEIIYVVFIYVQYLSPRKKQCSNLRYVRGDVAFLKNYH